MVWSVSKGDPRPKFEDFVDPVDFMASLILWCRIHGKAQRVIPHLPGTQLSLQELRQRLGIDD